MVWAFSEVMGEFVEGGKQEMVEGKWDWRWSWVRAGSKLEANISVDAWQHTKDKSGPSSS